MVIFRDLKSYIRLNKFLILKLIFFVTTILHYFILMLGKTPEKKVLKPINYREIMLPFSRSCKDNNSDEKAFKFNLNPHLLFLNFKMIKIISRKQLIRVD